MMHTFKTRQFKAGHSHAVRIPADMAFPPKTELLVKREGDTITVEPIEKTMENVPLLFAELAKQTLDAHLVRPEFIEARRDW